MVCTPTDEMQQQRRPPASTQQAVMSPTLCATTAVRDVVATHDRFIPGIIYGM